MAGSVDIITALHNTLQNALQGPRRPVTFLGGWMYVLKQKTRAWRVLWCGNLLVLQVFLDRNILAGTQIVIPPAQVH